MLHLCGHTYVKGVFVRFCFDDRRTSQIPRQVKNKAAKNAPCGVFYIQPVLASVDSSIVANNAIYSSFGFSLGDGLKGQKLLAQGIALGMLAARMSPCKGKSFPHAF